MMAQGRHDMLFQKQTVPTPWWHGAGTLCCLKIRLYLHDDGTGGKRGGGGGARHAFSKLDRTYLHDGGMVPIR